MAEQNGIYSDNANDCVDRVIERVGKRITLGLPLGLGKPVRFVNALYQRAKDDPEIQLHIVTALSLLAPEGSSSLEKRFMGPFARRLYGNIPELAYARDVTNNRLPANVTVSEFFFKAFRFFHSCSLALVSDDRFFSLCLRLADHALVLAHKRDIAYTLTCHQDTAASGW